MEQFRGWQVHNHSSPTMTEEFLEWQGGNSAAADSRRTGPTPHRYDFSTKAIVDSAEKPPYD